MKRLFREEKGQTLVFVIFMVTGMLAFAALALDGANAFFQRAKMQHAADSVARSGAFYLASNFTASMSSATRASLDATLRSTLDTLATSNGYPGGTNDSFVMEYIDVNGNSLSPQALVGGGSVSDSAAGVRAAPTANFSTIFLNILNFRTLSASASAKAIYGSLGAASCANLFPATINGDTDGNGVYDANFVLNACYIIRDDNSSPGGGSFGWVDLNGGGGGASELSNWINSYASGGNTGCNTTITVGTGSANLETETGNKASLQSATLNLINSTHNEVTVAIYDNYGTDSSCSNHGASGSNLCYRVKGFGRFRMTHVWVSGSEPQPNPGSGCSRSSFDTNGNGSFDSADSKGILGMFVGYVDPNGQVSADAVGPAKATNIIS